MIIIFIGPYARYDVNDLNELFEQTKLDAYYIIDILF